MWFDELLANVKDSLVRTNTSMSKFEKLKNLHYIIQSNKVIF